MGLFGGINLDFENQALLEDITSIYVKNYFEVKGADVLTCPYTGEIHARNDLEMADVHLIAARKSIIQYANRDRISSDALIRDYEFGCVALDCFGGVTYNTSMIFAVITSRLNIMHVGELYGGVAYKNLKKDQLWKSWAARPENKRHRDIVALNRFFGSGFDENFKIWKQCPAWRLFKDYVS